MRSTITRFIASASILTMLCGCSTTSYRVELTPQQRALCFDDMTELGPEFGETTRRYAQLVIQHRECLTSLGISPAGKSTGGNHD